LLQYIFPLDLVLIIEQELVVASDLFQHLDVFGGRHPLGLLGLLPMVESRVNH